MIRHLLKLVWKRKRGSALLTLEILISFLVLFGVGTLAATGIFRYRRPLGFDYRNVWVADISLPNLLEGADTSETSSGNWAERMRARRAPEAPHRAALDRILRELRAMPQIEAVAAAGAPAYSQSTWDSTTTFEGRRIQMIRDSVTDGYDQVMRAKLVGGRWFVPEDETANVPPMVIDTDLAKEMFPGRDAVGQTFTFDETNDYRIVGVVEPFRKRGEFDSDKVRMAFDRVSLSGWRGEMPRSLVIRIKPGTPVEFEESLTQQLRALAPDYGIRIRRMDAMRESMNRQFVAPMVFGVIVSAFLIFMVGLGLSGVLWQNVTRRRREIGLRRALGATGSSVHRQILIEVALLATLAVIIGVVIVAQLPILGIFNVVTPVAYAVGLAAALATIYALTLVCGLYPSWLAGRVQPAEALHYE